MRWQQFALAQVTFDLMIGVTHSSKLPKMVVYLPPPQKRDVASRAQGPERTKSQEAQKRLALAPFASVSWHVEAADRDAVVAEAFATTKVQKQCSNTM
jgi:hypothetical protein